MDQYVGWYKIIETMEEYGALTEAEKKVDCIVVMGGKSCVTELLRAQLTDNTNLKFVHSLSAGIEPYIAGEEFRNSAIPLCNAKGAFSVSLGEFIALGVLYHTKRLERFMGLKKAKKWEPHGDIELVCNKTMAIMGYGDIGAAVAKIAKNGFDMKVIGIKRNPASVSEEARSYCEEVVGND